jgi:hypothetical protein
VHDLSSSKQKAFNFKLHLKIFSKKEKKSKILCKQQDLVSPTNSETTTIKKDSNAEKAVKLKQEKALKFHVINNMEGYWEQSSGHATAPHPVKFER